MKYLLILLSIFFVFLSFYPSLVDINEAAKLPPDRAYVLEHNYMFDYNFYLSRIREGTEGNWQVSEKYYSQPHKQSLFQVIYVFMGRIGKLYHMDAPAIYHAARILIGLAFLIAIARYSRDFFKPRWQLVAFLFAVTAGSWPMQIQNVNGAFRIATYMGWWSAIDSLQRITFIPHVVFGQLFILLFIWRFGKDTGRHILLPSVIWGIVGLTVGIIFPPALVVVYTYFAVVTILELIPIDKTGSDPQVYFRQLLVSKWLSKRFVPRIIFALLSFPSLIYTQMMFKVLPWSALALFDIEHRPVLPYTDYFLALGPVLVLGLIGGVVAFIRVERKLFPAIAWILSIFFLFKLFENFPQQSPLRFTEAAITVPLGILAAYLFSLLWQKANQLKAVFRRTSKIFLSIVISSVVVLGLVVMVSMVGWLTDQIRWKREGTWQVPVGTQIAYPLKEFMNGIYFLRDNTDKDDVVLAYVTAGNYIPAYAGNYVYIGHANTPSETEKEKFAERFFSGNMAEEEAKYFLNKEHIRYIYFGPQERQFSYMTDLRVKYPWLTPMYYSNRVAIYRYQ